MASQEARRAQLKAEIRREIDSNSRLLVHTKSSLPKTGQPQARVVVEKPSNHFKEYTEGGEPAPRPASPMRSELYLKNFHSQQALQCIRHINPSRVDSPARVNSPGRRGTSPARSPAVVPAVPPAVPEASPRPAPAQQAPVATEGYELRVGRAGVVNRSSFSHHDGIVFPDTSNTAPHSRLWLNKPLADGTRHVPSKRLYPGQEGVARDGTPKRSESPGGKRHIQAADHLAGCAATITVAPPLPVSGRRHLSDSSSRTNSPARAPYFEAAAPEANQNSARRDAGLLGFGPSGRSTANKPADHAKLLDEETGKVGPEPVARGLRLVDGKSHTGLNVVVLHEYPADVVKEERFKPSVVVMHGPPSFVAPPPPVRTMSPRRGSGRQSDNDIFNTAPQSVTSAAAPQPPLRLGRGSGMYSPARSDRPF